MIFGTYVPWVILRHPRRGAQKIILNRK
uniref:Uncharacterized protein n=1 Tax=Anguilla anguilla TaxID=7936 RepID=A0A0E9VYN8_ANGAN